MAPGLLLWVASRPYGADSIAGNPFSCFTFDASGCIASRLELRWRIEEDYEDLKQEVGLGDFEGRTWRGFHHHASLCIAAYAFLIAERARLFPPRFGTAPGFPRFAVPRARPWPSPPAVLALTTGHLDGRLNHCSSQRRAKRGQSGNTRSEAFGPQATPKRWRGQAGHAPNEA